MTGVLMSYQEIHCKNYTIEEQLSDPKIHLKTGMETYTDKYLIKE
jgi:hypothetical protein